MSENSARSRSPVFLLAAAGLATFTAGLTHWLLSTYKEGVEERAAPPELAQVVIAVSDLNVGQLVKSEQIRLIQVPRAFVTEGTFLPTVDLVVGSTPTSRIYAGEILHPQRFVENPETYGVEAALTPGTRAISMRLEYDAAVSGLVAPGRYVDVIVTVQAEAEGEPADWYTETVIQSARILAVDDGNGVETSAVPVPQEEGTSQGVAKIRGGPLTVTLELSPDEAERLSLAIRRGDVRLALRRAADLAPIPVDAPLVARAMLGLPSASVQVTEQRVEQVRERVKRPVPIVSSTPNAASSTTTAEVVEGSRVQVQTIQPDGTVVPAGRK